MKVYIVKIYGILMKRFKYSKENSETNYITSFYIVIFYTQKNKNVWTKEQKRWKSCTRQCARKRNYIFFIETFDIIGQHQILANQQKVAISTVAVYSNNFCIPYETHATYTSNFFIKKIRAYLPLAGFRYWPIFQYDYGNENSGA